MADDPELDLVRARYARIKAVAAEGEARSKAEFAAAVRKESEKRATEDAARKRATHKHEDEHMANEPKSRLDQIKDANLKHALDVAVEKLVKQGVHEVVALTNIENDWTFIFDGKARVIPYVGAGTERRWAVGWSDDALRHFAAQYHFHERQKLGGSPSHPGPAPVNEMKAEADEQTRQRQTEASARAKALDEQRQQLQRERDVNRAQEARRAIDPRNVF